MAASRSLVVITAAPPSAWWRFWQRKRVEPSALDVLSATALRAELAVVDEEISQVLQKVALLESTERDALVRRDKDALDVAWLDRETLTAHLEELDQKRTVVYQTLAERVQPRVEEWRGRATALVETWRREDSEQTQALEQCLRKAEALAWELMNSARKREAQRLRLQEDFQALLAQAQPVPVSQPDVDWTVSPVVLTDSLRRCEAVVEMLRVPDVETRLGSG